MDTWDELTALLAREVLLLKRAKFKLSSLRSHLIAGEAEFLNWASEEAEAAIDRLREVDLRRAAVIARVASSLEPTPRPEDAFKAVLAQANEPHKAMLTEAARAIRQHSAEVQGYVTVCRRLAETGDAGIQEVLGKLTGIGAAHTGQPREPLTYSPASRFRTEDSGPRFDRAL